MSEIDADSDPDDVESAIPDVSAMKFVEVLSSSSSALAEAVRRVVDEVERTAEAISGWSSYAR